MTLRFFTIFLATVFAGIPWSGLAQLDDWASIRKSFSHPSDKMIMNGDNDEIVRHTRCQLTANFHFAKDWSQDEENEYLKYAKRKWEDWWNDSGRKIAKNREENATIYPEAWKFAQKLLNGENKEIPETRQKIWIPKQWRFELRFGDGDYGGIRRERWILSRDSDAALLVKVSGQYLGGMTCWETCSEIHSDISTESADKLLAALTYIYEYKLRSNLEPDNRASKFYYPSGSIFLDGDNLEIWALPGNDFFESLQGLKFPDNPFMALRQDVGIARVLLTEIYGEKDPKWSVVYNPSVEICDLIRGNEGIESGDSKLLLTQFGNQSDLQKLASMTTRAEKFEGDGKIPLIERAGRFSGGDAVNSRNSWDLHLKINRRYAEVLEKRLLGGDEKNQLKLEKNKAQVDWDEAGKQITFKDFDRLRIGEIVSLTYEGVTYTWEIGWIQHNDNGSYSGLTVTRKLAEIRE